jgi:hypothetical protein
MDRRNREAAPLKYFLDWPGADLLQFLLKRNRAAQNPAQRTGLRFCVGQAQRQRHFKYF